MQHKIVHPPRHFNRCRNIRPSRRRSSFNLGSVTGSFSITNFVPTHSVSSSFGRLQLSTVLSPLPTRSNSVAWEEVFDCGLAGSLDLHSPIYSLDQLYYQAIVLNPILIQKIKLWAVSSGGFLRESSAANRDGVRSAVELLVEESRLAQSATADTAEAQAAQRNSTAEHLRIGSEYAEISAAQDGLSPSHSNEIIDSHLSLDQNGVFRGHGSIKWGNVKSVERAIEKASRSYGQASRINRVHDFFVTAHVDRTWVTAMVSDICHYLLAEILAGRFDIGGSLPPQYNLWVCRWNHELHLYY